MTDQHRERLGKFVRDIWVTAVRELIPDPKLSWVEPWETLPDPFQREVDMRIGAAVAADAAHRALCWVQPDDGRIIACDRAKDHKGKHSWEAGHGVTDDMIDRAFNVIAVEAHFPYLAMVGNYVTMSSTGAERETQLAALKAADEECTRLNREFVRRVLEAAINGTELPETLRAGDN